MKPLSPVVLWPMYVDKFINDRFLKEVTSLLMYEPSSTVFHPDGLYSEQIFGQIGSPARISNLGYIDLHTEVLVPMVYRDIINLVGWYDDLMRGVQYARFDTQKKEFVMATRDDLDADTGYTFFMSHIRECTFQRNESMTRNDTITKVEKTLSENTYSTTKMIVCPAGWRDIKVDISGHIETEAVNKLYGSLLAMAGEINLDIKTPAIVSFFDTMRYNIQKKLLEIYLYFENIISGKEGVGQQHYAKRSVANGTRDVITTPTLIANSPDEPDYLKCDETLHPLYLLASAFRPLVVHQLNLLFTSQIYTFGSVNVPAINPKTLQVEYIEVTPATVTEALSTEAKQRFIQEFKELETRHLPVTVPSITGEEYYLWMVYDLGDSIYLFRSLDDLEKLLGDTGIAVDRKKIRPLTKIEMLYIATYHAVEGHFSSITRYPAIEVGSIYPTKPALASTSPSRVVAFRSQYAPDMGVIYPYYPVYGLTSYVDSIAIHPCKTTGLGADHDGDTVSSIGIYTNESTAECRQHMESAKHYVSPMLKLYDTADTNVVRFALHALTWLPKSTVLPTPE